MGAILNNDMPDPDSFTRRAHDQVGDSADRQGCAASLSLKGRTITHAPSAKLHMTLLAEGFWYAHPATGILGLPAVGAQSPQRRRFIQNCVWLKKKQTKKRVLLPGRRMMERKHDRGL